MGYKVKDVRKFGLNSLKCSTNSNTRLHHNDNNWTIIIVMDSYLENSTYDCNEVNAKLCIIKSYGNMTVKPTVIL